MGRRPAGKHFTVRIEADLWPCILDMVREEGNTKTEVVNRAIRFYITMHNAENRKK